VVERGGVSGEEAPLDERRISVRRGTEFILSEKQNRDGTLNIFIQITYI
jgi:hypothetical protein